MKKILILFAHPSKSKSVMNIAMREKLKNMEQVTFHDLYDAYPDFLIDVKKEQKLLEDHDVIVFQHPFYWFQAPALVKEWLDEVLEYGWAYGRNQTKLKGKVVIQAITAGFSLDYYEQAGDKSFTFTQLTSPFIEVARLCEMEWREPFLVLGAHAKLSKVQVEENAESYRQFILNLIEEGGTEV